MKCEEVKLFEATTKNARLLKEIGYEKKNTEVVHTELELQAEQAQKERKKMIEERRKISQLQDCLLYTSDAADE